MTDKIKSLVLVSFLFAIYYGVLFYLLSVLNVWIKEVSLFSITYRNLDIRIAFIGIIFSLFGIWLVIELDDYLRFKEWRRKWK